MDKGQKAAEPLDKAWAAFKRVYCISLKERTDRREAARREFARVGLLDRVEFVIVDRHPTDSEQGIFESHMSCVRAGLDAGAQRILIFEDDVVFRRFSPTVLARAVDFVKSNGDWGLFFFGCFVYSSKKTDFRSVLGIRYRCCAHAYVVSRGFAEKLAALSWHGVAYDDLLRSLDDGKFFTCYPSFAYQSGAPTDNDKLAKVDWWRRHLGGMRVQQRWNEFSSRRRMPLIVGHLIFALLCILLVICFLGRK
jgi:GR25 family glycosyltransferase involved in LPS biosynthesis